MAEQKRADDKAARQEIIAEVRSLGATGPLRMTTEELLEMERQRASLEQERQEIAFREGMKEIRKSVRLLNDMNIEVAEALGLKEPEGDLNRRLRHMAQDVEEAMISRKQDGAKGKGKQVVSQPAKEAQKPISDSDIVEEARRSFWDNRYLEQVTGERSRPAFVFPPREIIPIAESTAQAEQRYTREVARSKEAWLKVKG